MQLVIDTLLPAPARLATKRLQAALATRDEEVGRIVIGLADVSPAATEALTAAGLECPAAAESLAIGRTPDGQLVAAGRDALGLSYAVAELERTVQCLAPGERLDGAVVQGAQGPQLAWRSVQVFLCNADCERDWFFSTGFWDDYLAMLVANRFNNLSLTVGHQTSYLTPPYPFFVDMPEFPDVHVRGIDAAGRAENLRMLQWLSQRTREHGLHFTFGIWTQRPGEFGDTMVEGLADADLARFNATGLQRLLDACPDINGLQFRMNYESGIAEEHQQQFYESQFEAVAHCGRPLRLDLRAKGLSDHVVDAARAHGLDVVVSTKFWCEHLGMPYAMPAIRPDDVLHYRRYGTWDLLARPQRTALIYRLWSAGSQRILQWGSPKWVRRFAEACGNDTKGFEVMAPLTNKGGFNAPGHWRIITDPAHQPDTDEQQRYFLFYVLFGRLGYDGDCAPQVWQRELQHRYGQAADPMAAAHESSGQILPLLTVVLQWSASLWSFWPEMFAGREWRQDLDVIPSDPTQFYGVNEYVTDALSGALCGKWSPFHVAEQLIEWSTQTRQALTDAQRAGRPNARLTGAMLDCRILAWLGMFHAWRLRAGVHLAIFLRTGSQQRYRQAADALKRARQEWADLCEATRDVYHHDLLFGDTRFGHCGHWQDRLPAIDADVHWLDKLGEQVASRAATAGDRHLPGEGPLLALCDPICELPESVNAGNDATVRLQLDGTMAASVICHAKPMLQPQPFVACPMAWDGDGWSVTLPGTIVDAAFDLILFFEIHLRNGEARRWPDWRQSAPYLRVGATT